MLLCVCVFFFFLFLFFFFFFWGGFRVQAGKVKAMGLGIYPRAFLSAVYEDTLLCSMVGGMQSHKCSVI